MTKQIFVYFFCLVLLSSCDCSIRVSGKILDQESGKPISNAVVNLLEGKDIKETDVNGYFDVVYQTGFCENPVIVVSKKGFKPFQLKISQSGNEISYTVKSESISVDYDEPVYPDPENRETFITGTWIDKWSQDFNTMDTLRIYLMKNDIKGEIEKLRQELENSK